MPEISIIVPVYNVVSYLEKCIASITSQTFTDWELILIDDGSTDGSADIAGKLHDKDTRIKIFSKPNGGVSSARNLGLDLAQGKYVMFVDSDDICHPQLLEILYTAAESDTELVMCNYSRFQTEPDFIKIEGCYPEKLKSRQEIYQSLILNNILHPPFAKLYLSNIIERHGLRFPIELQLGEDVLFNLSYLRNISRGTYVNLPLYFYRDTPASLSKKIRRDYTDIQLRILTEKLNFIESLDIKFDYTPYAPGIVTDIALSILRSDASNGEKRESLNQLRDHRIMDYCKLKGKFMHVIFANLVKTLPSRVLIKTIK